jgi:uncharacterized protein YigE (DUF2233 family)
MPTLNDSLLRLGIFLIVIHFATARALSQNATDPNPGSSPGIRYEKFRAPSGEITVHLVVFDSARYSLRVIDNGPQLGRPRFSNLADAMLRNGCVAGINGGFFDVQPFAPSGLMVADGHTVSPFDPKGWQEGVLAVQRGKVSLIERDAFTTRDGLTAGLQSSPWLIRSGQLGTIQESDSQRTRRVFVAAGKSGRCAIGFSTPATFHELAEILVSEPVSKTIEVSEALALDGATSAGFWCSVGEQQASDPELTTVRNFVGVVPLDAVAAAVRASRMKRIRIVAIAVVVGIAITLPFLLRRRR